MYNPSPSLPTEFDLPDSDDEPVDNELQLLVPALLRAILALIWAEREDWFMAVNMGLYYDLNKPAIGPDAFLSLGVARHRAHAPLRLSYVLWQEQVVPQLAIEIVSQKPGKEYSKKKAIYAEIGIPYYVIYNPQYGRRDKHDPFEVYRLQTGEYVRLVGEPVWMPEIGLGIGREMGTYEGLTQEWLYWYNEQGDRYPTPGTVIEQERQRAEQERQRAEQERQRAEQERQRAEQAEQALGDERKLRQQLLDLLREQGIDPEQL